MNVAVATAIGWFREILWWAFIIRIVISWISQLQQTFIATIVVMFTEPFISPIRRLISKSPLGGGMFDFSLMISWFLWSLVIIPFLHNLALTHLPT